MFMRLKSQRQLLIVALAFLAAAAAILLTLVLRERTTPDRVTLGQGLASVDTMPVSQLDPVSATRGTAPSPSVSPIGSGNASYYGEGFAGQRTASGEAFDPQALTAAHRTLPLGSRVRVTNPRSGDSVVVRINDRGPFHGNRVIDLSHAAARAIGLIRAGTGRVNLALLV